MLFDAKNMSSEAGQHVYAHTRLSNTCSLLHLRLYIIHVIIHVPSPLILHQVPGTRYF